MICFNLASFYSAAHASSRRSGGRVAWRRRRLPAHDASVTNGADNTPQPASSPLRAKIRIYIGGDGAQKNCMEMCECHFAYLRTQHADDEAANFFAKHERYLERAKCAFGRSAKFLFWEIYLLAGQGKII